MSSSRLRLVVASLAFVTTLSLFLRQTSGPAPGLRLEAPVRSPAALADAASPTIDPTVCVPANAQPTAKFANAIAARARREDALAKTAAFTEWLTAWRRSDATTQPALGASGKPLAVARRSALKHLIETDPKRALDLAIPVGLRQELPGEIQSELEQRVDSRGELEVAITHVGTEARYDRMVVVDGKRYNAFVFGRRESQPTKSGMPLHGIVIDDAIALNETPYRELDDAEKVQRGLAADRIGIAVGGEIRSFASGAELQIYTDHLIAAESAEGPEVHPPAADGGGGSTSAPVTAAVTSPPSWINGTKRVLWVQVDFSDDPGAVATVAQINTTNDAVSQFYAANSQGKTTMTFTVLPTVLRLPRPKSFYNASSTSVGELQDNANTLAKAYDVANGGAGTYDPDRYDRWIVLFNRVPAYAFGGQALLGGARVRLNNNIVPGTTGHELGHTQSLDHSHFWLPAGTSGAGSGTHVEYGDVFDIMGSSSSSANNHFNAAQKAKLGYLDANAITTVIAPGTYRINRHDHADASGLRALKIAPAELKYEYWVEHRRFGPTAFNTAQLDRLRNGVILHWGPTKSPNFTSGAGSYLVDTTPGSAGGANDSPLRIGESFTDPDAGLTIKPLAVGGTAPNEYIDVQVAFGAVDGNRNPTLVAEAPTGALNARSNVIFNASATDPDGDPVYFRWDFGDSTVQPILNNITRRFTKGGNYSLRVSAHDGKGGIAAKTLTFTVADPLLTWTRRSAESASATISDVIFAGGQFVAVGTSVQTSIDGTDWATQNTNTPAYGWLSVAHNGARYAAVGLRVSSATDRGGAIYSDDGKTWTLATVPTGTGQMTAVAYGAGRFVAVGELGRIYNSVDGVTWTNVTSPVANTLRGLVYSNDLFVVSGDLGRLLTSPDGVTWTNRSLPTSNTLGSVTRHNDSWYTSSATLEIYSSRDAITWTRTATTGRTNNILKLASISGVLFSPTANGSIAFTEEPRAWVTHQVDATPTLSFTGVAEGNGTIVLVGTRGLIYTAASSTAGSTAIAAPTLRNDADSLKVSVGRTNVLSASGAGFTKLELYANGTKVSELNGTAGAFKWTPAAVGNYSLVVRGINAAGESVVSTEVPAQSGLANWNWRNPSPVGTDLNAAVKVGNRWWIVGGTGTLVTLDPNGTLTPVDFPTTQRLTGITYGNGRFVVSGPYTDAASREDIGSLWTSTDGYAWTPLLTDTLNAYNLNFVNFADNRFIAGSTGGTILTSTDGLVWARQNTPVTSFIRYATFANGLWVAVGAGGRIITSPDAVRWTERTSGVSVDLWGVAFNNGTFAAVGLSGTIVRSTDGITWTRATSGTTSSLFFVSEWNGSFIAAGNTSSVLVSPDGVTWTPASLQGNFSDIFYAGGSGNDGLMVGRGGEIYAATTPSTWRRLTKGTGETRFNVIYAGGRFVSVGQGTDAITRGTVVPISVSTDGITWTRANSASGFGSLNDVTYGQQRYVAVGDTSRVFTSTDGMNWTQRPFTISSNLTAVAAGPDFFVAASSGAAIYSSPDGETWTQRAASLNVAFRGAAYGNRRYVVVGDNGGILQSPDGLNWTAAASGVTASLQAVGWWESFGFIAVGNAGTMIGSLDGITWQQIESGVSDNLTSIALTPVGLLAAGGTVGTSVISLDGANWSISPIRTDHILRGIAASPTAIVAVGDNGSMLTFELADNAPAPVIIGQPQPTEGTRGATVTFSVSAQNTSGAVFQWLKDGVPILGANSPVLTIPAATDSRAGAYTVAITTGTGTVLSAPARLTFGVISDPGRLVNLSILTTLTGADDTFTFGVVVGGAGTSGSKALLVRAAGPSLTTVGLPAASVLQDPKLEFFTGGVKVGENNDWSGAESVRAMTAQVAAFPFASATSRDAALALPSLASGANSATISGTGAGTVIAELYDATPSSNFTPTTPRLVNVSVLKHIGGGVTAGFVVGGSTPRRVLIRAIGPTLGAAPFNVGGVVVDPQLALFSGSTQIAANDNWGGTSALTAVFSELAAFPLPANSRDAALLTELQPGSYTVQVSGAGGTSGVALIEVYEVP